MGEVFGKPKDGKITKKKKKLGEKALAAQATITEKDRAILNLKTSRDKLKRYQKDLEVESVELRKQALSLAKSGKKSRALLLLKVRKLKEDRASEIDSQLYTLYVEIEKVESAVLNATILKAIEAGTKVLHEIQQEYSIDRVEQLMEDSSEAIEKERQITSMLSKSLMSNGSGVDTDADFEEELRGLGITDDIPASSSTGQRNTNNDANIYLDGAALALPEVPVTPVLPTTPHGEIDASASARSAGQVTQQQQRQQPLNA